MAREPAHRYQVDMRKWSSLVVTSLLGVALCASLPACDSASAAVNPLADIIMAERGERLQGQPVEIVRAGSYTYIDLELSDGQRRWVVLLGKPTLGPDESLAIKVMGTRSEFRSNKLDRVFDELTFGFQVD